MSKNNALYVAILAFSLGWLYYNFQALLAPIDAGDGLMHFFLSQASWENPVYFLDHWGKPLFILLSSPFAQLGFSGMILFNSLVFVATTLIGWKILSQLKTPIAFQLAFPLLLLLTPEYSNTVLSGLTEPLFSLFLIAACWTWLNDRFFSFAFIVGCMPFLRSEGQLVVIFAIGLLLFSKQWKAFSFLGIPFLLYALLGLLVFHDFWWYFTKSPYSMDNSFYGIGSYWHYLREFKTYLGIHGVAVFLVGFIILSFQFFKKLLGFKVIGLVILTYGTFLGVLAAHSYFYGSGQNGSMGLTRIATQGLPSFLLINLYFLGSWLSANKKQFSLGAFAFPLLIVFLLCITPYLHKSESRINRALLATAHYIKNEPALKKKTVYAYHPLLAYALESNLKMENQQLQQFMPKDFINKKQTLSYGDIIVWDSQFGPFELSLPFAQFMQDSNLMLCHQEVVPGGLAQNGVFLFQYVPADVKHKASSDFIEKTILRNKTVSTSEEYTDILKFNPSTETYVVRLQCQGIKDLSFVCVPSDNSDYQGFDTYAGEMNFEFTIMKGLPYSVYIWNPTKKKYTITVGRAIERKIILPKPWGNETN